MKLHTSAALRKFIVCATFISYLLVLESCNDFRFGKPDFIIVVNIAIEGDTAEQSLISQTKNLLIERCKERYGKENEDFFVISSQKSNQIQIKINYFDMDSTIIEDVEKMLSARGKLEFWETYDNKFIYPLLVQANNQLAIKGNEIVLQPRENSTTTTTTNNNGAKSLGEQLNSRNEGDEAGNGDSDIVQQRKRNPLFFMMGESSYSGKDGKRYLSQGPAIGLAQDSDTATIHKLLIGDSIRKLFPLDLKFTWSLKPIDKEGRIFSLVALKAEKDGRASMHDVVISEAHVLSYKAPSISFKMNGMTIFDWANLTRKNIGKSIAIVLDNKVVSYPTVQSEIIGGITTITGNFTDWEARDFAILLNSPSLPLPVKIERTVIYDSNGRILKQ